MNLKNTMATDSFELGSEPVTVNLTPKSGMKFATLYSRTQTNAVQIWQIIAEGNSYHTISGQIDGVKTTSSPVLCEGKNIGRSNETTAEQQAVLEAESKHTKKLKSGYFLSLDEIDNFSFVEPMLAQPLAKVKKGLKFPCILQLKYNGGRCIITKNGMFTRTGEKYVSAPHIWEAVSHLFEKCPDLVLDGELYNYDMRKKLNELMSLVRKSKHVTAAELQESKNLVRYYVYDGYGMEGLTEEAPYNKRKQLLDAGLKGIPSVETVVDFLINNQSELDTKYNEFLADGQEGGIVRYADNKYEHKRSNNLIKLKNTDDAEFLVTGISEGKGNWSGVAKIIHCKMDSGREFDATFKGTMDEARVCLTFKDRFIDKKYTIFYNGLTGYGVPNYAQFSWDNSVPEGLK